MVEGTVTSHHSGVNPLGTHATVDSELTGRGVLLTGGVGDIGLALTRELCERGAEVTVIDVVNLEHAQRRLATLGQLGSHVNYQQCDVRDRSALTRVIGHIPSLDVIIGNAGIGGGSPFLDLTVEDWEQTIAINLTGCFNLGQLGAREMVRRGDPGKIVFVGSWVGRVPYPQSTAYGVSKAGLEMLMRQMARELAEHGITVNLVAPGIVDAGLSKREIPEGRRDPRCGFIPLGRLQTAEEVARAIALLCGRHLDYMTGAVLLVDGGCSLLFKEEEG